MVIESGWRAVLRAAARHIVRGLTMIGQANCAVWIPAPPQEPHHPAADRTPPVPDAAPWPVDVR